MQFQVIAFDRIFRRIGGSFNDFKRKSRKAVVVLYLSTEKHTVVEEGVVLFGNGNHGGDVGNGGYCIKQCVRGIYITIGSVKSVIYSAGDAFGKGQSSVLVRHKTLHRGIDDKRKTVGKLRLKRPLHGSALGDGKIADIGELFGRLAGIGGIVQLYLEIQQQWLGKYLKFKGLRAHSHSLEIKLLCFLHVFEKV